MWFYLVRCPRQSICCKQEGSSAKVTLGFSLAFVFFCILRCPPIPSKSEFRFGFGGGAPCTSLSVDPAGSRESEWRDQPWSCCRVPWRPRRRRRRRRRGCSGRRHVAGLAPARRVRDPSIPASTICSNPPTK